METEHIPVSHAGFVRRSEMDTSTYQVWQSPAGEMQAFAPGGEPSIIRIKPGQTPLRRNISGV